MLGNAISFRFLLSGRQIFRPICAAVVVKVMEAGAEDATAATDYTLHFLFSCRRTTVVHIYRIYFLVLFV